MKKDSNIYFVWMHIWNNPKFVPVKGVQPDVEEETTTELDLTQENILNEEVHIINEPIEHTQKLILH